MLTRVLTTALLSLTVFGGHALAELPNVEDRREIRSVIDAQLQAFRDRDSEQAFQYATPALQTYFGNHQAFISMVQVQYQPIYSHQEAQFQELVELPGGIPAQEVFLLGRNDEAVIATYAMEQQSDGEWRIGGVMLREAEGRML